MPHIMLDLETLGTRPGCAILSIGAIEFEPMTARLGREFHCIINRQSCKDFGLNENPETLAWWRDQSDKAKETLETATLQGDLLYKALADFAYWCDEICAPKDLYTWGNGADFDLPILAHAYHVAKIAVPWTGSNGRCYRTIKNLAKSIKIDRGGTHHHALDDARDQAVHLQNIVRHLRLKVEK